jgi:hypothetical protein
MSRWLLVPGDTHEDQVLPYLTAYKISPERNSSCEISQHAGGQADTN